MCLFWNCWKRQPSLTDGWKFPRLRFTGWLVVYIRGPALCLSKSLETCKLHLSASDPNHKWQLWLKLMSPRKLGKPTKNQWGGVISVHLHLYDIVYQNSCNVSLNLFNLNIFSVIFAPLAHAPAWCILFFFSTKKCCRGLWAIDVLRNAVYAMHGQLKAVWLLPSLP